MATDEWRANRRVLRAGHTCPNYRAGVATNKWTLVCAFCSCAEMDSKRRISTREGISGPRL